MGRCLPRALDRAPGLTRPCAVNRPTRRHPRRGPLGSSGDQPSETLMTSPPPASTAPVRDVGRVLRQGHAIRREQPANDGLVLTAARRDLHQRADRTVEQTLLRDLDRVERAVAGEGEVGDVGQPGGEHRRRLAGDDAPDVRGALLEREAGQLADVERAVRALARPTSARGRLRSAVGGSAVTVLNDVPLLSPARRRCRRHQRGRNRSPYGGARPGCCRCRCRRDWGQPHWP